MPYLIAYVSGLVTFLAIDYVWLSRIASGFYRREIGDLMLDKPNLGVAVFFYLLYVAAIVVLVVNPALEKQQWWTAALYGTLLGLVAYGAYDITNLATLKGWSVTVSLVDMLWGSALTAVTATVSYFVTRAFA